MILGFSCDKNLSSILQYAIKSKETRRKKIELKKGVGMTIKSEKTSSWLAILQTAITHHPVLPIDITCVWSNTITAW